jgi:aspartate racemase
MRTLGLIGGMTWHSTVDYYRLINQGVQRRLGGTHSAEIFMCSVDFSPVEHLQNRGEWGALGQLMAGAARSLESVGAEALVICANTMHRLADDITSAVKIPLIHIADATAAQVKAGGLKTVGLLGTRYTMEMDFYRGRLEAKHGLKVLVPDEPGRTTVHEVIYKELAHGIVKEESRRRYVEVIDDLVKQGAQGVILGCTEIPMLVAAEDSPIPIFDTTAIHAAAAVDFSIGAGPQK